MPKRLVITNCKLFDAPDGKETAVIIENGTIKNIGQIASTANSDDILDAQGKILAPGFIDIHIHGAGGADVLDGTREAMETISQTCARFGVTGFLATSIFYPGRENKHLTVAAENEGQNLGGANLLGIHLEGPFISPERKAMLPSECVCAASSQLLDTIQSVTKGRLRMMTIAPELPGSLPIIQRLIDNKVIASFGHSNATYEQTLAGFDAGISHVTHLFNAMPSLHHRQPGPLLAIFESKKVTIQLIPDGIHIHPAVLRFTLDLLGSQRVIPISDGMQALGLSDGKYVYRGMEYESENGTVKYKDGMLMGTALGLNQLLKRLIAFSDWPLHKAIDSVTENPARLLGIEQRKGSIKPGKDADLVLIEPDLSVHTTIVGGKIVYQK